MASRDYIVSLGIDADADIWKIISFDVSSSNAFDKFYDYLVGIKDS